MTITPAATTTITVSGRFASGVPTDGSNLVARALAAVGRTAAVHIDKQIPNGGGLGGGSADAAAILRWAGVDDVAVALGLGADVPFCAVGGRARVTGVGEIVEPLTYVDRTVTLVVPPLHVSTPLVYRAWDELGGPTGDGRNDLEPAAIVVEPRLAEWRDRIEALCGRGPDAGRQWRHVVRRGPARRRPRRTGRRGRSDGAGLPDDPVRRPATTATCGVGGACGGASSCASSSASACAAS